MNSRVPRWCCAVAALAVTACASAPPTRPPRAVRVASITRNLAAYMARNYSPALLPSDVRTTIAHAGPAFVPFGRLVVTRAFVRHDTERGVNVTRRVTDTYVRLGNGYLEDREQISLNTIPTALNLNLSYLGLLSLEHQHINYRFGFARRPLRLQRLSGLTPGIADPRPGRTYRMRLRWLRRHTSVTCHAAHRFQPARKLLADLPGQALDLSCTIRRAGQVKSRSRMVYLSAYHIFLILQRDTPAFTVRGRILSIKAG